MDERERERERPREQVIVMLPFVSLKRLDSYLLDFLEKNRQDISQRRYKDEVAYEELLCCCERARHAIKDFTNQGEDGKLSDCFPVAGDALCDLQWCLFNIFPGGVFLLDLDRPKTMYEEYTKAIARIVFPVVSEFLSPLRIKTKLWLRIKNKLGLWIKLGHSVSYSSDTRNGHGSAHLPPGLNVDDIGAIEHLSVLGEGSQGTVHKARWSAIGSGVLYKDWGQLVAVKEVSSETRSEGLEALEAVVRSGGGSDSVSSSSSNLYCELNVLKTLNHPNIVELKGYTRKAKAGKYGLVMELMKCSLRDLIESETLSDLVKVDTLLQVARGMHFLHSVAGIMHRDLKPANILISELNYLPDPNARCLRYVVAKLADFGLSKGLPKHEGLAAVDRAGWHTYKQGTNFYMAPELRKSCNAAEESWYAMSADVFSFGTTCFNVLTGEEDPCAEVSEFYKRIKRRDLDQLLEKLCGASQMTLLVRQCWCPDPKSRPFFAKICQILVEEKRRILEEEIGRSYGQLKQAL